MHSIRFLVNCYEILTNFLLVAGTAGAAIVINADAAIAAAAAAATYIYTSEEN